MDFSEKLKTARLAKQMSQKDLAEVTGLTTRTIQNYETAGKLPRNRETYRKLAEALGISEEDLLDGNTGFVLRASARYGNRGAQQAWDLVADLKAMWAGGEMAEDDMDEIMQAVQDAYWEAKKNNRKYVNKRFRNEDV